MSSLYRFAVPFVVRLLGLGLALVGVLVLLLAGVVLAASLPAAVLTVGLVVALVAAVLVLAGVAALRRRVVVRLDEGGYRVRSVRGAGVREARWKDVEDVTAPTVQGRAAWCSASATGGPRRSPSTCWPGRPDAFVRDLQEHLDRRSRLPAAAAERAS